MLKIAVAVLTVGLTTAAWAQNRLPLTEPDVADYCIYGGQLYSLGASICVGRELAVKCIRYSSITNELRDLNASVDDQTKSKPVWLNVPQKLC
jgi:hypothetical protein